MVTITVSKDMAITLIQGQIDEGRLLTQEDHITNWKTSTCRILEQLFSNQRIAQEFAMKSFPTSQNDAHATGLSYLENLICDINRGLFDSIGHPKQIDVEHFHLIVRRILSNFYKHIEEMYQKPVHGRGTLKHEDLSRIVLGNEYDVQRMLYSLIRPIFPDARIEIYGDGGYKSYRYDIIMDPYETIIEVKCSRPSMTERELTEQIGSDSFHYQAKYIYFFIYDKDKVITNVDAFCKTYSRSLETHGQQIETYVIQPITI